MGENTKKPIYKKWWFWVIIVIIVIVIASSSSSDNTSKTTLTSSNPTDSNSVSSTDNQTETKTSYKAGEVYEDKSIAIKFVAINTNFKDYNEYSDIKKGCKIIKADFEFENVGSSDFLASAYDFNCYADGYDCEAFWSAEDSGFSSNLSTGKKTKGSVYFQVPKEAKKITLEYETNMWTNNKVTFVVK